MPAIPPEQLPKPLYTKAQVDALLAAGAGAGGLAITMENGVLVVTESNGSQWKLQQSVPNS